MASSSRPTDRLTIFGGRSHPAFTAAICAYLCQPVGRARLRTFSDGAIEVKLEENVRGHDVFIVQSGHETPNDYLLELTFLIDAARRASAHSVTAVLPYLPYTKGDKKDEPRVSIRARVVADILEAVGADRVLTMDLHAAQLQGFFKVPVDNLYGLPVLAREIEARADAGTIERPVMVAPDVGRAGLAREYLRRLAHIRAAVAIGDKVRPEHDERSEVTALLGDVQGRDTILVDDILFTGGTLCGMAEEVIKAGARSVRAVVAHALFTGSAVDRIKDSPLDEVICTDTVPLDPEKAAALGPRFHQATVAPLFAEAVRSIYQETSISRLFD
ncbi:MAG TPA: ribose-phosphate diphosphokinase [Chloroflexota bacterium]|nr:ribose-phosphate diphosphokinase [Chloroflexota bacterium]